MFLEVRDGLTVNLETVDRLEKTATNETLITQGGESFTSSIPYETLRAILKSNNDEEE
jgi:hypothetical protein